MIVRFFTRHSYGGWRSLMWLPVALIQGRYVHCEVMVDGRVLNADMIRGVQMREPVGTPAAQIEIPHDAEKFNQMAKLLIGAKYSWAALFRLLLPRYGSDPKGMICSELVAHAIAFSASDLTYRIPFIATPPYRWTPNNVYEALANLKRIEVG